ncbi:hypothetical protein Taro_047876 [Colocasia esculenta]|uniref:Uncharacterized protein n=1 Tax=Colocasia esculenta TaxID=4460 RepID=A0A843X5X0_COLES|nr:hypothetical protein [Colocasia esculenta]
MSHHKHGHLRPPQGRGPTSRNTLDPIDATRSGKQTRRCHHGRHQGTDYGNSSRSEASEPPQRTPHTNNHSLTELRPHA